MKLKIEKMTEKNISKIIKIKRELFPESNSEKDYEYAKNNPQFAEYYLCYYKHIPCAITGWYDFDEFKTDAFMGWYGVLPEFRNKGIGKKVFKFTVKAVKKKSYKYFRLYTDVVVNATSVILYEKQGMFKEPYSVNDTLGRTGNFVVFTLPLKNEMKKWDNKPLNEDNNYSGF